MIDKDRRKDYEARLRSKGLVKLTVWATPDVAAVIRDLAKQSRDALPNDG